MIKAEKIFKNALSNGTAFAVEAVAAFVMMPFIVHRIGDGAYGVWLLINAITGYLSFLKLGLRPAINKHVAEFKALRDQDAIQSFVQTGFFIYLFSAMVVVLATGSLYFAFDKLFQINPIYIKTVKIILLMAGIQTAFGLMGTLFGGVISGYQRYDVIAGIEIFVVISRSLIILFLLPRYCSLMTVAIAHFTLTTIGYIINIFYAKKISGIVFKGFFKKPSKKSVKKILRFSIVSVGISIIGILAVYSDNVIVGVILPTAAITHYAIGSRLIKYSNSMIQVVSHVIAPATSELKAKKQDDDIARMVEYTVKVFCLVIFPILLCLLIQGDKFILLWMGKGYEQSYYVTIVLAIAAFFILPQQILNPILYGLAQHHYLLYVSVIEVILSILFGFLFGKFYGMIGIAIGFSFPRMILRGIIFPIFIYKKIRVKIRHIIYNCYMRIFIASTPFAVLCFYFIKAGYSNTWFGFLIQLLFNVIVYGISCWMIGLSSEEKKYIKAYILNKSIRKAQIQKV